MAEPPGPGNPMALHDHSPGPRRPSVPGAVFLAAASLVAALLLFSTVMKLAGKPPKEAEAAGHWALVVGQVAAAGLIVGQRRRPWAWSAAALVFAMFGGVALFGLVNNAKSCGCFGALHVPPAVTLTLDATVVGVSLALARLAGAGSMWLSLLASALLPMSAGGAMYAKRILPPEAATWRAGGALADAIKDAGAPAIAPQAPAPAPSAPPVAGALPTGEPTPPARLDAGISMTAQQALLLLPKASPAYLKGAPAPAWLDALTVAIAEKDDAKAALLFVYSPHCDVCRQYLPFMESFAKAPDAASKPLRVVLLDKADLEKFDIPDWAWPASPTVLLVSGGRIVHEWGGHDTPQPVDINAALASRGKAYVDEMAAKHVPLKQ